jgi:ABC-type antimicrobial peptide transport system permease subunit
VRTNAAPLSFANAVRSQVQAIDRDQASSSVKSLEELEDAEFGQMRLIVPLLSAFAFVAALLALTGIDGVIAYSVAQRTQEVGIRRALGAQYADILRLILRLGLILAIAGIVLGAAGGLALTRFLKSLLFDISPTDPARISSRAACASHLLEPLIHRMPSSFTEVFPELACTSSGSPPKRGGNFN